MSDGEPDDLIAEAARLDGEAITVGEERPEGRELRQRAAALRISALGPRPYPVLVCTSCYQLTGWTTARGECDACARHAAFMAQEAASDRFPSYHAPAPAPAQRDAVPWASRLAVRLGSRRSLTEATVRVWIEHVDPGETGPIDPEERFELETARRDEVERLDGAGMLVRFHTSTLRFADRAWTRLGTTRIARVALPNPAEFAADLPVEVLVEAWTDYQQAVTAINHATWQARAARVEDDRARQEARERAAHEQAHTADLLDE